MSNRMPLVESLTVLSTIRTTEVVVTTMGTAREWMLLSSHPLDFVYVPSSMGQAPSLALGIALARPDCKVIVCNGDGSLLMNAGSLVTISAKAPANLVYILFDNGVYEVTGAQSTPAAAAQRADNSRLDYAKLAQTCGFQSVYSFSDVANWREQIGSVLAAPGPTFVSLNVAPAPNAAGPKSPGPARERARQFAAALQNS